MDYEGRIARTRAALADAGCDALLVTDLTNVRYLTGFSGTNGQVLIAETEAVFMSDPRYEAQANDLVHAAEIAIYPERLTDVLSERLQTLGIDRLGFEAGSTTVAGRDDLARMVGTVELVATSRVVEGMRRAKDPDELAVLRSAVDLGDQTFELFLDRIRPGITERAVALELEMHMRTSGAEDVSFEPIVGSGPLSAHIHHAPSDRSFEKGDLILLDFGCRIDGYCSDLTRTVVLGPATDAQQDLYALVLAAQRAGIEGIGAGVSGRDADAAARRVISDAGYAEQFGHGLGHGVGLEIHEAPRLHKVSEDVLAVGDVVTVEPGIYVRDTGGIRIEDCVVVTHDGTEVLSAAPKEELIQI